MINFPPQWSKPVSQHKLKRQERQDWTHRVVDEVAAWKWTDGSGSSKFKSNLTALAFFHGRRRSEFLVKMIWHWVVRWCVEVAIHLMGNVTGIRTCWETDTSLIKSQPLFLFPVLGCWTAAPEGIAKGPQWRWQYRSCSAPYFFVDDFSMTFFF